MAYITTEEVKEIRVNLKRAYPASEGWKFSVRRRDAMAVDVKIMTAPIQLIADGERSSVNHYHINGEHKEVLQNISDICNKDNWDKSEPQFDYFNCHFYFNLTFIHISALYWLTMGLGMTAVLLWRSEEQQLARGDQ